MNREEAKAKFHEESDTEMDKYFQPIPGELGEERDQAYAEY